MANTDWLRGLAQQLAARRSGTQAAPQFGGWQMPQWGGAMPSFGAAANNRGAATSANNAGFNAALNNAGFGNAISAYRPGAAGNANPFGAALRLFK